MAQLRPGSSSSGIGTVGDDQVLAKAESRREESLHVGWLDGVRGQAVWGWVVAHTLRFVLPRPHWLRLFPAQAQLPALRSFTKWMDVLGGLLLATSFNLFFFVAGAAAFMTLRDLSLAELTMGDYTSMMYKAIGSSGGDLQLVFPLFFFLWLIYLPLFRTVRHCYQADKPRAPGGLDLDSYNTLQNLSFCSVMGMVFFAAATPVLVLWLWFGLLAGSLVVIVGMIPGVVVLWYALCRNGQTREAGPEQQDWVLSIVLRLVSLLKRAGGHKSGLHFFLASTAIPLCIMCWANLYFSSVLVSTGVLLIYGAPFLMSYLRLPSTLSFSLPLLPSCTLWSRAIRNNNYATHQSSDAAAGKAKLEDSNVDDRAAAYTTARRDVGEVHPEAFSFWLTTEGAGGCGRVLAKGHISTAAACLLAIVAGHIAFLGSLDVVHPNVIPLAAPILGIFRMDLNKNYGIYCLAFGFFSKKRSNLFVIAFAIFSIVFLRLSLPGTKWKWILISPSLVTYSTCLQRFWKYFSEGRRSDESTPTFLSSRLLFFVFITHSFWEYCLVSMLRASGLSETLPWMGQIVLLNACVVGLTFGSSWLFASYAPEGPGISDHDRQRRLRVAAE
ncbi:uncharacterized protein ACA1_250790 [Acanthamoeba castellanii str. Neff]|uniref:Uncharacterized protein n=1 Tax=Acanthamoeba castellanii (strain ATCC 30010 / Neff) TaxID=1257118 RepID=L8HBY8_ACACF|nr:uncharacterized protein ACA1_250790 [Acanthamoeba castellanii str. Neff]ELR22248.1 hypothetical protein ACA1_250790 [Acanthamoeba castellanii str. Neff]